MIPVSYLLETILLCFLAFVCTRLCYISGLRKVAFLLHFGADCVDEKTKTDLQVALSHIHCDNDLVPGSCPVAETSSWISELIYQSLRHVHSALDRV